MDDTSTLLYDMLCQRQGLTGIDSSSSGNTASTTSTVSTTTSVQAMQEDEPLHRALAEFGMSSSFGDDNQVKSLEANINRLVAGDPASLRVYNKKGLTPLHVACKEGAPSAVIESLVKAWPESIHAVTRNKKKMLPLHLVCRYYNGSFSEKSRTILYLLRSYPSSVGSATPSGDLPLHLCCRNAFCSLGDLRLMMKMFPDALTTANKNQQLPLHIACEKQYMEHVASKKSYKGEKEDSGNSSDEIIRCLVQYNPATTNVSNAKGELALHAAIRGYQTPQTLAFLMSTFPSATAHRDLSGRTPLHIAVSRMIPSQATIQLLRDTDSNPLALRDTQGRTPVDYAPMHDVSSSLMIQSALAR